jgi:hypothetical protein
MILRLAANAAVHTAGGVVFGVTAALAACTVARAGAEAMRRAPARKTDAAPPSPMPSYAPPPSGTTAGSGDAEG